MSSNESPLKSRWEPRNPMSSVLFIFVECRGGVCLTVWEVKKPQDFFFEGWVVVEVWFVVAVLDEIFWSFFCLATSFFFPTFIFLEFMISSLKKNQQNWQQNYIDRKWSQGIRLLEVACFRPRVRDAQCAKLTIPSFISQELWGIAAFCRAVKKRKFLHSTWGLL